MPTLELTEAQAEILSYMVEDWVEGIEPDSNTLKRDLDCTEEDIQKVREANDLVEVIGERTPVKQRGRAQYTSRR